LSYSFASLREPGELKRQKDQVNHCGKRLRDKFNGKDRFVASKSGPDGQNLHSDNTKHVEDMNFSVQINKITMKDIK
jgi:hypothetical protein